MHTVEQLEKLLAEAREAEAREKAKSARMSEFKVRLNELVAEFADVLPLAWSYREAAYIEPAKPVSPGGGRKGQRTDLAGLTGKQFAGNACGLAFVASVNGNGVNVSLADGTLIGTGYASLSGAAKAAVAAGRERTGHPGGASGINISGPRFWKEVVKS